MTRTVAVLGAGGHAKVVIATLRAANIAIAGVFDDDEARRGEDLSGVPIVGTIAEAAEHEFGVIAIGSNTGRRAVAEMMSLEWVTVVHPSAIVDASVILGAGSVLFAGTVVQPDTRIGGHAIVNTAASIDHDCDIGAFAHIAPGCHLSGGVSIGEGTLLGVGASAIPLVSIGEWARVGAGAVVVRDIPGHVTAVGVPARPLPQ